MKLKTASILACGLIFVLTFSSCREEGTAAGKNETASGQGQGTEWEVLTGEVMELYRAGDYDQGVKVAQRALQVAQQNDGPDHPNVALSLGNLAELHEARSEYAKAESLYKRSLKILEKEFGRDSPFLVPLLFNMASLYTNIGKKNEARRVMERANSIQAKQ